MTKKKDEKTTEHSGSGEAEEQPKPKPPEVKYSMSGGLVPFLNTHNIAIAATSYQSGRLYLLSRNPKGGLMVNEQFFQKAMGLHPTKNGFLLATLANIFRMQNVLRDKEWMAEQFTQCYIPRTSHFTGYLDLHDVGLGNEDEIYFVNTAHNCICTLSDTHSFKPWWKPDFVSKIVAEDRCHLNGMAMQDGKPKYATAVSKSDTIDGWRDRRADGGILIDIEQNKIICEGLSMPHSPRVYNDKVWLLNSGTGELGTVEVDEKSGKGSFKPFVFCPGFVRGLSFHGNFAFVGLSKPRYERFEGLELDNKLKEMDSEPWCGLQIIDLTTGTCVQWFRIDGDIGEMYDVAVLPGVGCAKSISPATNEGYGVITIEKDKN